MKKGDTNKWHKSRYKGIIGIYFNKVIDDIIKLGNLKEEEGLILDFGCGVSIIRDRLPHRNIIGYDIVPELSDIDDYKQLTPNKVISNAVCEHLTKKELEEVLNNFKKMNVQTLVVGLPTENKLSKFLSIIVKRRRTRHDHKLKLNTINEMIEKRYNLIKRKAVFTMSEISLWKNIK